MRFDPARLEVLGDPVTVVERVLMKPTGAANYAVSRQGTLVYVPSGTDERSRRGRSCGSTGRGARSRQGRRCAPTVFPRLSPDGTRVVVAIYDQENTEIWIWDLARETLRRLTFAPGMDGMPRLDTRRPADHLHSERTGVGNLYATPPTGPGPPTG